MRYALINPQNQIDRFSSNVDPNVQTKAGWKWLSCPTGTRPVFDPATELVEGPFYTVNASDVTESFTKRSFTAEELDARKDVEASAYQRINFLINFDQENRIRALESKTPITQAQYRAAIKARL